SFLQSHFGRKARHPSAAVPAFEGPDLLRLHSAAEQGIPEAQFRLGHCCLNGLGVPEDCAMAAIWWRKAARQELPEAQFNLGLCSALGKGVPQDAGEAAKWFR